MSRSKLAMSLSVLPLLCLSIAAPARAGAPAVEHDHDQLLAEPEDDHLIPVLPDFDFQPIISEEPAEYPLAASFAPADPSNHSNGGMISYDYVVVHTVQGSYAGCISWFQNPAANVSAHFVARSSDGEITQMVHLSDKAWHVGNSNGYAIGIEHEGWVDEPAWYTWEMYSGSSLLSRWIADDLGIPLDRNHIVGHSELPNQTHTDPGVNWNWDLYMALITEYVGQNRIEGYVVDNSAQCTITANVDTFVKSTLESSSDLDANQKCSIPAGTQLTYLHAGEERYGHRRLSYDAGGPCDGIIDLQTEGYIFGGHFTPTCSNESKAAAGVTVSLDGNTQVVTDAAGYFAFNDVIPGDHTLDVLDDVNYVSTLVPVSLDVFPGTRVIIGVDPIADTDSGDGGTTDGGTTDGGTTGGECWVGAEDCPCTPGGGCDPGLVCEADICVPSGNGGGTSDTNTTDSADEAGADDQGLDYLDGNNCSVVTKSGGQGEHALFALALLSLLGVARRRR